MYATHHVALLTRIAQIGDPLGSTTAAQLLDQVRNIGKVLADGWVQDDCIVGRGLSSTEYWHRPLSNGRNVLYRVTMPGPFDRAAGLSTDMVEEWKVWVGWEKRCFDLDDGGVSPDDATQPPNGMVLPYGAIGFVATNFDGDVNWYVQFRDEGSATGYAQSLPALTVGVPVPPFNQDAEIAGVAE